MRSSISFLCLVAVWLGSGCGEPDVGNSDARSRRDGADAGARSRGDGGFGTDAGVGGDSGPTVVVPGAPVAELEVRHPPGRDFMLTASVALSDPALMSADWVIGDRLVQREIISRDADGRPSVVQVIASVAPQAGPYALTIGTGAPEAAPPPETVSVSASVSIGARTFVATPDPATRTVLRSGQNCLTTRTFGRFVHGSEANMGAHFYVTHYPRGSEVTVRVSNAVIDVDGTGFNGAVYYDRLAITVNGVEDVLAAPLGGANQHLFLPQAQTQRRYSNGSTPRFARVISENGLHEVAAYGAERQKLPRFTDSFTYGGLSAWDAIEARSEARRSRLATAFSSGLRDDGVDMFTNALGPFMPIFLGDSGASAPGGWGISPAEGYQQTQSAMDMLLLQHRATMDRIPTLVIDAQGNHISTYDFAAANGGVQPFYHSVIGGWGDTEQNSEAPPYFAGNQGRPYNTGTCPYRGAKWAGGLRDYEYYDDAHYIRGTRFPKALVYLLNDPAARDDLLQMAEFVHYSWGEIPHGNDYWITHGHSTWRNLMRAHASPGQGGGYERAFGWAVDSMAQAYAVATPEWRGENRPFFEAIDELVGLVMMPSGFLERQNAGSFLSGVAVGEGFPADQDLCGAIYLGIVAQGLGAVQASILPDSTILREQLDRSIHNAFAYSPYPNGPAYYMSVAPVGGAPYAHPMHFNANGHAETFNFWWAAMHAYRATGNVEHFDRLRTYNTTSATHAAQAEQLFVMASGWDDRLGNAAYYIAEAQSP